MPKNAESSCFHCRCGRQLSLLRDDFYINTKGVKYALCAENYPFCPTNQADRNAYLVALHESYVKQFSPQKPQL
jgi:hypothetical protein